MLLNAVSVGDVYTSVTEILTMIWGVFGSCISTITGNPILFASVLLGLGSSVISVAYPSISP